MLVTLVMLFQVVICTMPLGRHDISRLRWIIATRIFVVVGARLAFGESRRFRGY